MAAQNDNITQRVLRRIQQERALQDIAEEYNNSEAYRQAMAEQEAQQYYDNREYRSLMAQSEESDNYSQPDPFEMSIQQQPVSTILPQPSTQRVSAPNNTRMKINPELFNTQQRVSNPLNGLPNFSYERTLPEVRYDSGGPIITKANIFGEGSKKDTISQEEVTYEGGILPEIEITPPKSFADRFYDFWNKVKRPINKASWALPHLGPIIQGSTPVINNLEHSYRQRQDDIKHKSSSDFIAVQDEDGNFHMERNPYAESGLEEVYPEFYLFGLGPDALKAGIKAEINTAGKALQKAYPYMKKASTFLNSPYTGKWTTIGNRQYRLSPNTLGMNGVPVESRNTVQEINISPEELYKILQDQKDYYFLGHGTGRTNVAPKTIFNSGLRVKNGEISNTTTPISETNLANWPHLNSEEIIILPEKYMITNPEYMKAHDAVHRVLIFDDSFSIPGAEGLNPNEAVAMISGEIKPALGIQANEPLTEEMLNKWLAITNNKITGRYGFSSKIKDKKKFLEWANQVAPVISLLFLGASGVLNKTSDNIKALGGPIRYTNKYGEGGDTEDNNNSYLDNIAKSTYNTTEDDNPLSSVIKMKDKGYYNIYPNENKNAITLLDPEYIKRGYRYYYNIKSPILKQGDNYYIPAYESAIKDKFKNNLDDYLDFYGIDKSRFTEIPNSEFRKMLPARGYIGGSRENTWLNVLSRTDWAKEIESVANKYGVDKNLLMNRLMHEGFLDHVAEAYNEAEFIEDQENVFSDYTPNAFGDFGLDYAAKYLRDKQMTLLDDNIEWQSLNEWTGDNIRLLLNENMRKKYGNLFDKEQLYHAEDIENLPKELRDYLVKDKHIGVINEKGKLIDNPSVTDLNAALHMMAADMKRLYDLGIKRGYPKGDMNTYINAMYNMGENHRDLNNASWIKRTYSVPDWYTILQNYNKKQTGGKLSVDGPLFDMLFNNNKKKASLIYQGHKGLSKGI